MFRRKKAIVTDIAGTTRDVIEEYVNVRGVSLKLIDTAGIRETEDVVERIGVERSKEMMSQADLVLVVVNYSEALTNEDEDLFRAVQGKEFIVIVNKTDLPQAIDMERVTELAAGNRVITTSLIEEQGIDELEKAIADLFFEGTIDSADMTYVSNARHIGLLTQAGKTIGDAVEAIENGVPIDMVQIDLTRTWEILGEITGDTVHESLIDQLFSQFCLGK